MSDIVEQIQAYESWKQEQALIERGTPEAYGHYLEIEKELRILKAARHFFECGVDDIDFLGAIFDGIENALVEEEAKYED